jgi:hypothetical protein
MSSRRKFVVLSAGAVFLLLLLALVSPRSIPYRDITPHGPITPPKDSKAPVEPSKKPESKPPPATNTDAKPDATPVSEPPKEPTPIHKPQKSEKAIPIVDNFPSLANAKSRSDLPPVPTWNAPPKEHIPEKTILFIGFTRNWPMLQQVVTSWIVNGWPPEDIYVVENTGTLYSNKKNLLTIQNPFYINYERLTKVFGVNVITTPTLLTFAQLQNFFVAKAVDMEAEFFFWSHMDVVCFPPEDSEPHQSIYSKAVDVYRKILTAAPGSEEAKIGAVWFAYDNLSLVRVAAYEAVGGWDSQIPYYMTDCDMHERVMMAGYTFLNNPLPGMNDVAEALPDLRRMFRLVPAKGKLYDPKLPTQDLVLDDMSSAEWKNLTGVLRAMDAKKHSGERNTWQARQTGGKGEPYYRDSEVSFYLRVSSGRSILLCVQREILSTTSSSKSNSSANNTFNIGLRKSTPDDHRTRS